MNGRMLLINIIGIAFKFENNSSNSTRGQYIITCLPSPALSPALSAHNWIEII